MEIYNLDQVISIKKKEEEESEWIIFKQEKKSFFFPVRGGFYDIYDSVYIENTGEFQYIRGQLFRFDFKNKKSYLCKLNL
jgi:hypothetical protein